MKKEQPFNPLPLPDNLKLSTGPGPAGSQEKPKDASAQGKSRTKRPKREKAKGGSSRKKKSRLNWEDLKSRIHRKLAELDKEKLKQVLLACGIAAGVVGAIFLALKLFPVGVLILAVLGLGAAMRFWDRLRWVPCL